MFIISELNHDSLSLGNLHTLTLASWLSDPISFCLILCNFGFYTHYFGLAKLFKFRTNFLTKGNVQGAGCPGGYGEFKGADRTSRAVYPEIERFDVKIGCNCTEIHFTVPTELQRYNVIQYDTV
jgi:hypothetical protein